MGQILKIQQGTVVKVKEVLVNVESEETGGAFAGMAASAAETIAPGWMAASTAKLASSTGSLMDDRVEVERYVKVRILLDSTNELAGLYFNVFTIRSQSLKVVMFVVADLQSDCRFSRIKPLPARGSNHVSSL